MLAVKIFRADDLEDLETQMQTYLDSVAPPVPPGPPFDWVDHDVLVQYDGKATLSRMSYSALIVIKPNK